MRTSLEVKESILTKNPCYKAGNKIKVKGIMIDSVGCPQPSGKVFIHNWNRPSCDNKCVHAFVDANDGTVYQTLPWNHRGWHAGRHPESKQSANRTHIGIALCEPAQIVYRSNGTMVVAGDLDKAKAAAKRTYESTVELCAMLCEKYSLDPESAIVSHSEGYDREIASSIFHLEKMWELLQMDYTMNGLREDVIKILYPKTDPEPEEVILEASIIPPMQPSADPQYDYVEVNPIEAPVEPTKEEEPEMPKTYMVQIDVPNLRIRNGPGTEYNPIGKYTGIGLFKISEIQNGSGSKTGWGKLESGDGWISLDHVTIL